MRPIKLLGKATVIAALAAGLTASAGAAATAPQAPTPYGGEAGGNQNGGGLIVLNPQGSDSLIEIDRTLNLNLTLISIGDQNTGSDVGQ